jgi:CO dehydrogenase maturation factor
MPDQSIKLAISGKGGVGKTTIAALLCRAFADRGYSVLAVDADPDANLAAALGFPADVVFTPLVEMKDLIEERTGAKPGTSGGFFKINPEVHDVPEMIWREKNGIRLMVMGTVKKGGGGCICPESAVLKALMSHLLVYRKEAVILDMEAGIEHLGRGTAGSVDRLIVVVEPGKRSIDTAMKIVELASDIGLKDVSLIANKIRSEQDRDFILQAARGLNVLGFLSFDEAFMKADMLRIAAWEADSRCLVNIGEIAEKLIAEKEGVA